MGSRLDAAKGIWVLRSRNRPGFFTIGPRGEKRKKEKKEKMNERGGTVLSAPALYLLSARGRAASRRTPAGTCIQEGPALSPCSTHGQSAPITVPS